MTKPEVYTRNSDECRYACIAGRENTCETEVNVDPRVSPFESIHAKQR